MRKPVPEYFKLMEDKGIKYVSKEEISKFIDSENKGQSTPLKYPKEQIFYRKVAMDHVVEKSLEWIAYLTWISGTVLSVYARFFLHNSQIAHNVIVVSVDFIVCALVTLLVYNKAIGNRFFVVIDTTDEMLENLRRKTPRQRRKIFKTYPECKDLYLGECIGIEDERRRI